MGRSALAALVMGASLVTAHDVSAASRPAEPELRVTVRIDDTAGVPSVYLKCAKDRAAEVFALRYLEGLSNPQIASLLGTSQAVVAVTLHRTRGRLRKEIRPLLGD